MCVLLLQKERLDVKDQKIHVVHYHPFICRLLTTNYKLESKETRAKYQILFEMFKFKTPAQRPFNILLQGMVWLHYYYSQFQRLSWGACPRHLRRMELSWMNTYTKTCVLGFVGMNEKWSLIHNFLQFSRPKPSEHLFTSLSWFWDILPHR